MVRRSVRVSSETFSTLTALSTHIRAVLPCPFTQLAQEFVGRHVAPVLLVDAADEQRLLPRLEAALQEGYQHPVVFLLAVEEGTAVPFGTEPRSRQPDLVGVTDCASPFASASR